MSTWSETQIVGFLTHGLKYEIKKDQSKPLNANHSNAFVCLRFNTPVNNFSVISGRIMLKESISSKKNC